MMNLKESRTSFNSILSYVLTGRSRRPRQVIDDSDEEEVDEEGEYSGGEDLNAEFVNSISRFAVK